MAKKNASMRRRARRMVLATDCPLTPSGTSEGITVNRADRRVGLDAGLYDHYYGAMGRAGMRGAWAILYPLWGKHIAALRLHAGLDGDLHEMAIKTAAGHDGPGLVDAIVNDQLAMILRGGKECMSAARRLLAASRAFSTWMPEWTSEALEARREMSPEELFDIADTGTLRCLDGTAPCSKSFTIDTELEYHHNRETRPALTIMAKMDAFAALLYPIYYAIWEIRAGGVAEAVDTTKAARLAFEFELRALDGTEVDISKIRVIAYRNRISARDIERLKKLEGRLGGLEWR